MSRTVELHPRGPLRGTVDVPGDKSVSHRSLIFGSLASGPSRVRGLLRSGDVQATASAMRALGATIEDASDEVLVRPPSALSEPTAPIDCGNSGTTIRLLCGLLAPEAITAVLTGDDSLRRRPMARVADPLGAMGARIETADGRAPLTVRGGELNPGTRHDLSVASAQVKTALLLAGRRVGVAVREPRQSRDHTERLLRAMGAPLALVGGWLELGPVGPLDPVDLRVPRDLSAAAFWLVAGAVVPGSELLLPAVGVNPTRAGVIDALRQMGAQIELRPLEGSGPEPIADLHVRHGGLRGTRIDGELALRCLDELPVLAVAAAFADGVTEIRDAAELRVKESDRIARVVVGLRSLGVQVDELPDGMVIEGGAPRGPGSVDAHGDHRIAMAFAIASCAAPGGIRIDGAQSVSSSYPEFFDTLASLGTAP